MSINLLRESPSVLFCASDGKHLRVYQVVCNAKALLASQYTTSKVIVLFCMEIDGCIMIFLVLSSVWRF